MIVTFVCLVSLAVIISGSILVAARHYPLLFHGWVVFHPSCTTSSSFICWWSLRSLPCLAVVNSTSVISVVHVSFWIRVLLEIVICDSSGNLIFSCLKTLSTLFSSCHQLLKPLCVICFAFFKMPYSFSLMMPFFFSAKFILWYFRIFAVSVNGIFFFFFCPFNWSMTGRKLLICICLFCFQTTYYIFPSFSSIESSRLRGRSFPDKDHFISFQYFLVSFICGTYRLLGLLLKPLSGVKTTSWWASEPWLSWVTWSRLRFIAEAAVASEPGGTGCFLVS